MPNKTNMASSGTSASTCSRVQSWVQGRLLHAIELTVVYAEMSSLHSATFDRLEEYGPEFQRLLTRGSSSMPPTTSTRYAPATWYSFG